MAAPRGSFSRPFTRMEPTRVPKEPVLAVGWSVLVRCPGGAVDRVTLTDEDGVAALGTVKPGVEVEITAWRPRRAGPALYRVRTKDGGNEGWVSAANLERRPPVPVAKPVRLPVPVAKVRPTAPVAKAVRRPAPAAKPVRPATPVTSPVAKRVATKAPKRPQKGARVR